MKELNKKEELEFPLENNNYKIIVLGVILLVLGYFLMAGGKSPDPNEFHYDEIFSTTRMTLAPAVILGGFITVLVGIVIKPKKS